MRMAAYNSLVIPQLLPNSELCLRIVREAAGWSRQKGGSGATLLEKDFSDLHTRNRREQTGWQEVDWFKEPKHNWKYRTTEVTIRKMILTDCPFPYHYAD